ncbi:hypothetical protein HAV38_01465 [Glaciimonas immobilis]|nr:hypothetical protein HAV38_01465 [Glaciimonas immobilis]
MTTKNEADVLQRLFNQSARVSGLAVDAQTLSKCCSVNVDDRRSRNRWKYFIGSGNLRSKHVDCALDRWDTIISPAAR